MYKKKTIVIITMCIAIFLMVIGYSAFSTNLKINGTGAITSTWRVEFSDIRTTKLKGGATNKITPSVTATTATFEVDLVQPEDEITYEIDITNYGTLDAEVQGASYSFTGTEDIYVEIEEVEKGTVIENCSGLDTCPKVTMILKVGYDPVVTSQPSKTTKTIEITIDIGQYSPSNPTTKEDLIPELKVVTLASRILRDNTIQSDEDINFSAISSDTNGKGLYYTSTNTEDNKVTYYFRGAVENNYVKFAGFYWRIVRINEDGSVRLIYNGTTYNASGYELVVGVSTFNEADSDNAYAGYMYGTAGSSTYALTHANTNDSIINDYLDTWYEENLKTNYSKYLADAGFCNDRSVAPTAGSWYSNDTALGYAKNITYYGAYNRLKANKSPQFSCPNEENDLFTTSASNKGNKSLDYPIGMITADELAYAGGLIDTKNTNFHLCIGKTYWTMTPLYFNGSAAYNLAIRESIDPNNADSSYSVRPVINLRPSVKITGGTGINTDPYIVKTN